MSRVRSLVLFAAMSASITSPPTRADEAWFADRASARAVLREAGLTRVATSYVLQDEVAVHDLTAQINKHEVGQGSRCRSRAAPA